MLNQAQATEWFRDRSDAGRQLAARLASLADKHPVVLALPRGGVPVAFEVAKRLGCSLDVIVVRKLGVPFQPELGMGAVGEDDALVLNDEVVRLARVGQEELARVVARERAEVEARARRFRDGRPAISLVGKVAIVVDDGIATGGTAGAAIEVARARGAARVVLAVPVAPAESVEELRQVADAVVCLTTPATFFGVGQWYRDFSQVPDEQVVLLLAAAAPSGGSPPPPTGAGAEGPAGERDDEIELQAGAARLGGHLTVPFESRGLLLFAHGSGSSRHSPRNQLVARALNRAGFATLLFDLLSPAEEVDRGNVVDIKLLGSRLLAATTWAQTEVPDLPVGYFGASTGAAAALWAAAAPGSTVGAVVSRGGRPDLAGPRLAEVRAPTLLIVGGDDEFVIELNRHAARRLRCEHNLAVVPGATHLFEETGALETVAALARDWFVAHLASAARRSA
jgi:putative phosphoribosyl transferase